MSNARIVMLLTLLIVLLACSPKWSQDLSHIPEEKWRDDDRKAFLLKSPWVVRDREKITNWKTDSNVTLEITATWRSPYYDAVLQGILGRWGKKPVKMLQFDTEIVGTSAIFRGPLIVDGTPSVPLTHYLIIGSPLFKPPLMRWPTGREAALNAHKSLFMLPHPDVDLDAALSDNDRSDKYHIVDLAILPLITRHKARMGDVDIDECIRRTIGQIAARGVALVRTDQSMLYPARMVVLGHDIDKEWENAAWRMSTEEGLVIAPPVFIRLYFPAITDMGPWPHFGESEVVLRIESPRGSADICSKTPEDGLLFDMLLTFDFTAMRKAGPDGIGPVQTGISTL